MCYQKGWGWDVSLLQASFQVPYLWSGEVFGSFIWYKVETPHVTSLVICNSDRTLLKCQYLVLSKAWTSAGSLDLVGVTIDIDRMIRPTDIISLARPPMRGCYIETTRERCINVRCSNTYKQTCSHILSRFPVDNSQLWSDFECAHPRKLSRPRGEILTNVAARYLIVPELSQDDVVDGCGGLLPGEMFSRRSDLEVARSSGDDLRGNLEK